MDAHRTHQAYFLFKSQYDRDRQRLSMAGQHDPIIITQNGEAKMVVLSMHAYQENKRHLRQIA